MSYLDEAGLARYDGLLKDFALRTFAGPSLLNWQKTAAAGAVFFTPVPEMPIDPVVNFMFTETPPASGDKGPDNPSTITGVTAIATRCSNKNFYFLNNNSSFTEGGITFTFNSDGSVTLNGTCSISDNTQQIRHDFDVCPVQVVGKNVVISIKHISGSYDVGSQDYPLAVLCKLVYTSARGGIVATEVMLEDTGEDSTSAGSFASHSSKDRRITNTSFFLMRGVSFNNYRIKIQCEFSESTTPTDFEPPLVYAYSTNLNGTFYGGSVDLSTGVMTVTHNFIVYNGTESINYANGGYYYFTTYNPQIKTSYVFSTTHFNVAYTASMEGMANYNTSSNSGVRFGWTAVSSSLWSTTADLKAWLAAQYTAGTPLAVVYELAEPYTVQLTPTQIYSLSQPDPYTPRINTVYSDQQSIQVGYPKSPQASQTELTNAIVSLGGNV